MAKIGDKITTKKRISLRVEGSPKQPIVDELAEGLAYEAQAIARLCAQILHHEDSRADQLEALADQVFHVRDGRIVFGFRDTPGGPALTLTVPPAEGVAGQARQITVPMDEARYLALWLRDMVGEPS
jgi:hypothetical protein